MKKKYIQPSATAISLMGEGQLLSASTQFDMDTTNKMDACDAYSNRQEQPNNGPWGGGIWDNMD